MARKREEKTAEPEKQKKTQTYLHNDSSYQLFSNQLAKLGMQLRDVPGDGNCLFRALGDQLDGHGRDHLKHRTDTVKYMCEHRLDFEPFVVDDIPFDRYVANLRTSGTYGGNDALVAFARHRRLNIYIHQVGSPVWSVKGSDHPGARELHISYHNGDHYASVRKLGDHGESPADIRLKSFTDHTEPEQSFSTTNTSYDYKTYDTAYISSDELSDYDNVDSTETKTMHHTPSTHASDGVARAVQDYDSLVETAMQRTGCKDMDLVKTILFENFFDLDVTINKIKQHLGIDTNSSLWSDGGTGSRIHGSGAAAACNGTGARPKLNSKQTAKEKKIAKKKRAEERHRLKVRGDDGDLYQKHCHNPDTHIITQKVSMIRI